ncbi:phosphate ABC transporter substrate-binding protein PstS [Rhodoluna sp. KAS3]|uniref:phosphate ABC transporter substrate-binding protein PstS n=1 Tax=Rhodoluna sp. KAS3 TaxID=942880 RepID=UPI00222F8DAC|nr:phosphate ABC transporter substrate-binding protein PstS [Rhodoluna sp. KAS3]BDS49440.1 phosphate-binding protein PstS [Rhodoluna sp. KAS3]
MIKKSALKIAGLAIAGTIALTGCAANEGATNGDSLSGTLNGAGSSAMGSAQEAWIAAFQTANGAVTINYDPTGSGAGRESFIAGAVNFAGSDSYLKDEELALTFAACAPGTTPFEVPVYISPIAVIFNVEGVTDLNLDAATIAGIFKGDITKWNDAAIVALNPEANLPAANITAVHRSDDSGTTKNFSDYLSKTAEEIWDGEVSDVFPYQSGEGAKGTSGVVDAVTNGTNTIGYADASKAGSLSIAKLKVGEEFVALSNESAAAIVDASPAVEGRDATDLAIKIDRATTASGAYPLVLVSYLIGCNEYADPAVGALVKAYASYLVSTDGQAHAATSAGSAPLSAALTAKVTAVISAIK